MPACAFLGPHGSYTAQAATSLLPLAKLVPFPSIRAVFHAQEQKYAVLPLENTIHGVVQETLGCLLRDRQRWQVVRTLDKPISHVCVVPLGVELEHVEWVASHEQALGQCAAFLRKHLPRARVVPVPSTAQAAQALHVLATHNPAEHGTAGIIPRELHDRPGAAICSAELGEGLAGLVVAQRGVQDVKHNYTRFLLLRRRDSDHPTEDTGSPSSTFYRVDSAHALTSLLATPGTTLVAVHSKAVPLQNTDPIDGHVQLDTAGVQRQAYAGMYNKRYLVEIAGGVEMQIPGVIRL